MSSSVPVVRVRDDPALTSPSEILERLCRESNDGARVDLEERAAEMEAQRDDARSSLASVEEELDRLRAEVRQLRGAG